MITSYTAGEFRERFAYNEGRRHLCNLLLEELELIRSQ